jgi:hypothetical protein
MDLVRIIFYEEDAECILNMKLASQPSNDFPAWHYERREWIWCSGGYVSTP